MFIQEVVVEGFKSYGQKTVISGFDPQFNAITGLNGTGKSNILDAICFNLGITNLSQVRAGSLQDLIYKQGQAGITKATVTVTFNNSDPANSPIGYESNKQLIVSRQIMLGGKTKYSINGRTVNQTDVQNFFHSVQLNVNNPHFLIMQGRITKVLNMKPPEILSMIEEASGTRMYETKKEASLKILAKKQTKIDEIDACMKEDIAPALNKLQDERAIYATWQSNNIELERLDRFVVACQYKEAQEKIGRCEDDKQAMEGDIKSKEDQQAQKQSEADSIARNIKNLEQQRASETEGGLQALKKDEAEVSKQLVKYTTLVDNQKESMNSEKENLTYTSSQLTSLIKAIEKKEVELSECNDMVRVKEDESNHAEVTAIKARDGYQNAFAGIASEENATVLSIPEQVATWEKKSREAQSALQQGELHVAHTKESLKELKTLIKTQKTSYDVAAKEAVVLQAKVDDIKKRIVTATAAINPRVQKQLMSRSAELKLSANNLRDTVDRLTASVEAKLRFDYSDPERGFDRHRVKGLVGRLVRVKDPRAAVALEIAAGAKLYQVVVDTEQTGKLLLQKGQLKRRVTILPLNKLSSRCTDASKVHAAKSIASSMRGSAHLALELVGYDEEIRKAMEHTFGSTIICDTADVAKTIAFDRNVRNRTVTFDGDTYDPSGTLTGGSKNSLGKLLAQIDELSQASNELAANENELASIMTQLAQYDEHEATIKEFSSQLELSEHAYKICQEKLNSSSYALTQKDIDGLEEKLLSYQKDADQHKHAIRKANDELASLQSMEKNAKKSREVALKDMENAMKNTLKAANQIKAAMTSIKSRRDTVEAELQSLLQDKVNLTEQITSYEISYNRMIDEYQSLSKQLSKLTEKYEAAKKSLGEKQRELNENSKEIKQLSQQREQMLEQAKEASLEVRKLKHKLEQWGKDYAAAEKVMKALGKEHPWIEKEKQYFGVVGSDYDFQARDIDASYKRHKQLKAEQDKIMKTKLNKKVMGMIEKAESEYEDLRRKKEVIINDKTKIESVIAELDAKKIQALNTTWVKVTRDFGSIFSMLLPGTQAKLEPPEGCSVSDGLEVKVAFNGVWKESLTELSGGQRSLLALSLILALLLFKPAPMYILDEVDAALDLSHTQNIGLMLRTHFSRSQFIVVSLKEGMFNNANVIFRTKFVDGVSAVTRTAVSGRSKPMQIENDDENEPVKKKGRDKTKAIANDAGASNGIEV